ncbi:hypothetical protein FSP39_005833 [Pinctada imbricata]|uniref:Uncharacterized protein n=1 Tax=Pinctada imbricata TaxID=66713 RepID=A0AA88XWJ8_PINIB|nr:hypothetical protein FSP39_005833 [Pinctada imbricata]
MAENFSERNLKLYIGSTEEAQLKSTLKKIKSHTLVNHVIESCNAIKPVSFTNADVILQGYVNVRSDCLAGDYWAADDSVVQDYCTISYQQMFKHWIINDVVENGLKAVPRCYEKMFLCLLNFFRNKQYHQKAIANYKKSKGDESGLSAVLAEHYFSLLIPDRSYLVDENASRKHDKCPCKVSTCKKRIKIGNTAIGSSLVWHGYADIFLDQKLPVTILSGELGDIDAEFENDYQPVPKKMKIDKDVASSIDASENVGEHSSGRPVASTSNKAKNETDMVELCVEVKNKVSDDVLLSLNVIDQIIAETITNAFVQVTTNHCLKGRMIPTFGCSQEHVVVFLYDPEHDILLQGSDLIKLFEIPEHLSEKAAVEVWLFLNFSTFFHPNLAQKFKFKKSRFHSCVKKYISLYKKATYKQRFAPADTNFFAEVAMPEILKEAKPVEENI